MNIRECKKAVYTVITNDYDLLFPPLTEQPGWDFICFTDNTTLVSDYFDIRPLPSLPELSEFSEDSVKIARLIKILPHRFLADYDYSVYIDANRILNDRLDEYIEQQDALVLGFEGVFADAYSASQAIIEFKGDTDPLKIDPRSPISQPEKELLQQQIERFKKGGLKRDSGCLGTSFLGRQHNHKTVIKVMESWAKEVIAGSNFDEISFPYACYLNKFRWVEGLCQRALPGELVSAAEKLAIAVPHKNLLIGGVELEEIIYPENPPPPGGKYNGYPFLLTIGVPVSNQIDTIRRCLEHIKPLMDAIDSELVVVDTGSTDGTVEVCLEYGARVVNFPWINNMSMARNQAIQAAHGCWYMSIDDDEWFEDVKPIISFFTSGDYKKHNMAMYFQRNYPKFSSDDYFDYPALRIAKLVPSLHFEGRIHDALCFDTNTEETLPIMHLAAYAKHYGFASEDPIEQIPKTIRNLNILKKDLIQFPSDVRHGYQTIRELRISERCVDAYRIAYFSMSQFLNSDKKDVRMLAAIVSYTHYVFQSANAWKDLIRFSEHFLNFNQYVEYDRCMLLFILAIANFYLHREMKALEQVEAYYKYRKDYYALPKADQERQTSLTGIDRVNENSYHDMLRLHMSIDIQTNRRDDLRELLCAEDLLSLFHDNTNYRMQVMSLLLEERDWITIAKLYAALSEEKDDVSLEYILAKTEQESVSNDFSHIRSAFSGIDLPEGFCAFLLLRETTPDTVSEEFIATVLDYVKSIRMEAGSMLRHSLLAEAFRLKFDPEQVLAIMELENIDYVVSRMISLDERTLFLYRALSEWQQNIDDTASGPARYLAMKISTLLFAKINKNAKETYLSSFETLIERNFNWNQQLYLPEMLKDYDSSLLPPVVQSVCSAHEALLFYKNGDYIPALKALRKTLEKEPSFRDIVSDIGEQIEKTVERDKKQTDAKNNEFNMLLGGVKLKIEQLISSGQRHLSIPLIAQLEQLAPNDPDIKRLKQKANMLFN